MGEEVADLVELLIDVVERQRGDRRPRHLDAGEADILMSIAAPIDLSLNLAISVLDMVFVRGFAAASLDERQFRGLLRAGNAVAQAHGDI